MRKIIMGLFICLISLSACNNIDTKSNKPIITVSILPQKFFVDQIAGSWLTVNVLIPPGGSPHTYEPTPRQMKDFTNSQLYFMIGHLAFEKSWAKKLESVSPKTKFIDTSIGIDLIAEEEWNAEEESHNEHQHMHEGYNPHIWLSPILVKKQAKVICENLSALYPEHELTMNANLNIFLEKCDSVQEALENQLTEVEEKNFIVYHPVWNYLARDYDLKQVSIEHNGKEATADKLMDIIDYANEKNIRIVLVQKEFSSAQARTIAEQIHGEVAILNPLDYNWLNTMKEFGEVFERIGNVE